MKKLIYFYCKDLRGFDDTEFNFSSKYKIHFDKDTEILTIDKGDENYIDNFYGENIELNAIVGNNGAGKSTLLKNIYPWTAKKYLNTLILVFEIIEYEFLSFGIHYYHDGYVVEQDKKDVIFPLEMKIGLTAFEIGEQNESDGYSFMDLIRRIYITQILDQELCNSHIDNYSMGGIIQTSIKNDKSNRGSIISFFNRCLMNQADFLYNYDKSYIPFKINDYVEVNIKPHLYHGLEFLLDKEDIDYGSFHSEDIDFDLFNPLIKKFRHIKQNNETKYKVLLPKNLHDRFCEGLLVSFWFSVPENEKENFNNSGKTLFQFFNEYISSHKFKKMKDTEKKIYYFFEE